MTDRIAAYYDRLAALHGDTPEAVDAPDQHALDVRYRVLGDVCDMNGKSVLEVGCGHGRLGAYLTDRYPEIRYQGIDVSAGLLGIGATVRPELDLHQADLMTLPAEPRYDVVVAQGIFYLLDNMAWLTSQHMISKMWALADEAVAFTARSMWAPNRRDNRGEHHIDPFAAVELCRWLTPYVTLRHDYHLGDLCIYLYRKDSA